MSRTQAKKIVKNYVKKLEASNYPVSEAYLFGSYAKNQAHKDSDIDVAIISPKLCRNYEKNRSFLWLATIDIDLRIEPHGFTPKNFAKNTNPVAYEIRKTGIRIV